MVKLLCFDCHLYVFIVKNVNLTYLDRSSGIGKFLVPGASYCNGRPSPP